MVIFGVLAYYMEANGYSVIAFVLPFILGRDLERSFLIAMKYSGNNPVIFFKSHLCMALWLLILLTIIVPKVLRRKVGKGVPLQDGCIDG